MVMPSFLSSRMVSKTSSTSSGANFSEGSSSIKIWGLDIKPRPIANICCSPPERVDAGWELLSFNLNEKMGYFVRFEFFAPVME